MEKGFLLPQTVPPLPALQCFGGRSVHRRPEAFIRALSVPSAPRPLSTTLPSSLDK